MGNYTSLNSLFEATASAIRIKLGTSAPIAAASFPEAIESISTGAPVSGITNITSDGVYNVSGYASASVNVVENLEHIAKTSTVAAASNRVNSYTFSPTSNQYVTQINISVPSVSLSGQSTSILNGQSIELISNGVAIQTIQGTLEPTATYAVTSSAINSLISLGTSTLYGYIEVGGYDYTIANYFSGSNTRNFYCAYGQSVNQPYLTITPPSSNFRITYLTYETISTNNRRGYLDFRTNQMLWYIDATQAEIVIAGTTGWIANNAYTSDSTYCTSTIYIPCGGANEQYRVVMCGYYVPST